jgi:CO/xanthine dehydrogenase Mo-binding subunit
MIAEVAVANGEVRVERVVIACDCGVVVNRAASRRNSKAA